MDDEEDDIYEVEEVLNHKITKGIDYFLIHWKGFDKKVDYTWEPLENLPNCMELVFEYFSKMHMEVPNNILNFLDTNSDKNDVSENMQLLSSYSELEKSQSESDYQIEKNHFPNQKEQKQSEDNINEDNFNIQSPNIVEDNTITEENKEPAIQNEDILQETSTNTGAIENNITNTDNNFQNSDEKIDLEDSKQIEIQNEIESKSPPHQNLWDEYGSLFKIQENFPFTKMQPNFKHTREVELGVTRISGKRKINREIEYLVEWENTVDKYSWVKESKLNCDEEVRKYEQKIAKMPEQMPFSYFLEKYNTPPPPLSESIKTHENLIKLKKELLDT